MEGAHNWLNKPSEERNLIDRSRQGWLSFHAHPEEHWKGRYGLKDCVALKGILPCVGCVCIVDAKPDRSCGGVPSSVNEPIAWSFFLSTTLVAR